MAEVFFSFGDSITVIIFLLLVQKKFRQYIPFYARSLSFPFWIENRAIAVCASIMNSRLSSISLCTLFVHLTRIYPMSFSRCSSAHILHIRACVYERTFNVKCSQAHICAVNVRFYWIMATFSERLFWIHKRECDAHTMNQTHVGANRL